MRVLRQTDLPLLVEPPIRRCGILARSAYLYWPATSFPSAIVNLDVALRYSSVSRHSRRLTVIGVAFGTSNPMADLPGIGASTRTSIAARLMARLSARLTILLTLIPGAS